MEELLEYIEKLIGMENCENDLVVQKFYQKICDVNEIDISQLKKVLTSIQELYQRRKLKKDIFYLVLLSNSNNFLINELMKHQNTSTKLLQYSGSLYDYTIFKSKQWFEVILNSDSLNTIFDESVITTSNILKLIYKTNEITKPLNEEFIVNSKEANEFWKQYVKKIFYLWDIVEFCKSYDGNILNEEIFKYSSQHSCLQILYKYLKLEYFNYNEIIQMIQKEDDIFDPINKKQVDTMVAYTILLTVFNSIFQIKTVSNVTHLLDDLKSKLLTINHKIIIIELLENIYTILFLMTNHFSNKQTDVFFCQEPEIRLLLFLLKQLIDEIKSKNVFNLQCKEQYSAFLNIQKHVTNALWRMELVGKVKNSEKCERKLLKYMLAMPESLIQMCLKEGDYERAYQVVQVRINNFFIFSVFDIFRKKNYLHIII